MKKNIKYSLLSIILLVTIISIVTQCKKSKIKVHNKTFKNPISLFVNAVPITSGEYDVDIALWADQFYDFYNLDNTNKANTNTSFDSTNINSISVNSNNYYKTYGMFSYMNMPYIVKNSIFGFNTTIQTTGGSFANYVETMYVPAMFNPTYVGFTVANDGVSVSKSAGFTINFNTDLNNTHDNLLCISEMSNNNSLETYLPYNVASKTFTAADLAQFPVGADLDFKIARGNVKYKMHNGLNVQFRAGVIQHCTTFTLKP